MIGTRPALNFVLANVKPVAAVATEHSPYSVYTPWIQQEIRRTYPSLDGVVALTPRHRRALKKAFGRRPPVFSIPNAVAPARATSALPRRPVVLAAGRLCRAKGFDRLILAFADVVEEHPEWQLRICGEGKQRGPLEWLIAELELADSVCLAGLVNDIGSEMAEASIFAVTSRSEGMPMAMLEAMAHGLPVVSFDRSCGSRGIIENGVQGLLAEAGDRTSLARALTALMDDPEARTALGEAARRKAADYRPEVIGEHWEQVLDRVTPTPAAFVTGMSAAARPPVNSAPSRLR
jgi:glycosyltransferase involved in cell wall biosynthesis